MLPFIEQARNYARYHQRPLTRYVQFTAIIAIYFSFMILLSCLHLVIPNIIDINFAIIATLASLVYYSRIQWQLALSIAPIFIFLCYLGSLFSNPPSLFTLFTCLIALILGGIIQLAGYFIEGKRPDDIREKCQQVVIAPLLMAAELYFMVGWMQSLKKTIYPKEDHHES